MSEVESRNVYVLFGRHHDVQGIYAFEADANEDADYLGAGHYVEPWAVDYETVAVDHD